jgi:hypothetical protein
MRAVWNNWGTPLFEDGIENEEPAYGRACTGTPGDPHEETPSVVKAGAWRCPLCGAPVSTD